MFNMPHKFYGTSVTSVACRGDPGRAEKESRKKTKVHMKREKKTLTAGFEPTRAMPK